MRSSPSSTCTWVNEKAVMIVCCSLAYERMKRVASTGTDELPDSFAMVIEYLLRIMIASTITQTNVGKANCSQV